jgi:3-methyladenine DNA glycosylase/8-oxoguanine DNA glycosylase
VRPLTPVRIDLPVAAPYDFRLSTFRFRRFGDDPASRWHGGALHRVLSSGLPVRIGAGGVDAFGTPTAGDVAELAHLLGASFDTAGFARAHPRLAARAPGLRPPLVHDPFEALVTSVTAQQVSLRSACAMRGRFVERFGRPVSHGGVGWYAFPRQADLAGAQARDLAGLGLSGAKVVAVLALARAELDLRRLPDDEVAARLVGLPGIGPWTADWFLARCLGRPGAFAAGDLGVRKAVARWCTGEAIWPAARVRAALLPYGEQANLAMHTMLVPDEELSGAARAG